jgi:predicted RNase H-like nuclease (RuvC/YqgF family)
VEENGRLENENEGLRDLCQELLSDMADLEKECSEFRRKVRSAVLELTPHQKEDKHD